MRALLLSLSLLLWGWGCSIYSPFRVDNPENCSVQPESCSAGTVCNQEIERCEASLSGLTVSGGSLSPAFAAQTAVYTATLLPLTAAVQLTPTAESGVTVQINGVTVTSGSASPAITVDSGVVMLTITVSMAGQPSKTYGVAVRRALPDYLKASNTEAGDKLSIVALSGDTLAVGAPTERGGAPGINGNQADNSLLEAGAVYVFVRTSTGWTQQAYIKASRPGFGDLFGYYLALSGNTLAVGAWHEDSNSSGVNGVENKTGATYSGAVYVFQRTGTTWVQQAFLKASNPDALDFFGLRLALDGDTLAVGAYGESSNAPGSNGNQADNSLYQAGAVYVFQRTGTTWAQQAYLKADTPKAQAFFGRSVALAGNTLAVGAQATGGVPSAVYVFQRSGTVWTQQAALAPNNLDLGDQFGSAIALAGDTLAVGAPTEDSSASGINGNANDNGAQDAGAVYIFQRTGVTWTQTTYIKASNPVRDGNFGISVALFGDTLACGADGDNSAATGINGDQGDSSAYGSGAAYLFQRTGATWAQTTYIKASNTDAQDGFGAYVTLSQGMLAVSAVGEDSSATGINGNQADNSAAQAGAVYVFR